MVALIDVGAVPAGVEARRDDCAVNYLVNHHYGVLPLAATVESLFLKKIPRPYIETIIVLRLGNAADSSVNGCVKATIYAA